MPDIQEAEALAARLRMLFADMEAAPADRRARLHDEIQGTLAELPAESHAAFIRMFLEALPGWEAALAVTHEAPPSADARDAELRDPAFLVERLEDIAPALTPAQCEAIAARLESVGLARASATSDPASLPATSTPSSPGAWPEEALARLRTTLRMDPGQEPEPGRLLELAVAMAELVTKLDQLAWSTWRAMAPRSEFKRRGSTQESMRKYLAGDPAVSREQVAEEIERLRSLAGALISTVAKVGFLAYRQLAKNAPNEIEILAKPEKKAFESLEVACWRKYRQLAGNLDQALVEAEVLGAMSDSVEALVRGLSRSTPS